MIHQKPPLSAEATALVSGGSIHIKHYIDVHRKELGILKALGYSNLKIVKGFWVFGFSIFIGTALGFCSSFALMPIFYTYNKLKCPVLELLKGKIDSPGKRKKYSVKQHKEVSFLQELKQSTVKSRTSLIFFISFASFCYSAMMQMSFSMGELTDTMMKALITIIGLVLACTTLFLAISTVVNANTKTIAMMKIFGYSFRECTNAILNGYRAIAYVGFAIGTIYQYALVKIMVSVVFIIVLISFALIYEAVMYGYSAKIKKISITEIMLE